MNFTDRRNRLRGILSGNQCLSPASVYDALSARIAENSGYQIGMLAGSVASNTTLAAPDIAVLTMTELADQIRRITRACSLSLIVDADHGYGNALNVMRTVEECEHSGVSAMTIEDTMLPTRFGNATGNEELIPVEEGVGKMKAALCARRDKSLIIAGRTSALKTEGVASAVARAKAYAATGVDAIFLSGAKSLDQVKAVHEAVKLPIIAGLSFPSVTRDDYAAAGVRVQLQGHQPVAAVVKVLQEIYAHLQNGGAPEGIGGMLASEGDMKKLVRNDAYKAWQKEFLR